MHPDFLGLGFSLHPDSEFLELTREILEVEVDYFEVNPEALWRPCVGKEAGEWALETNDYHALFRQIRDASGKPFVAHGLGFSLGAHVARARHEAWLERLAFDHECFDFVWLSEHLGFTCAGERDAILPLPLPFTDAAVSRVTAKLAALREVVSCVAFENSANYFAFGEEAMRGEVYAERAAGFLRVLLEESGASLALDLHNVHTEALNFGFDPFAFVDRLDLGRVLQIHVSGGSESEEGWLASGRRMRLDSHDGPVPERVWDLLAHVLPRCTALRGVVLERMNGSFTEADVPALIAELQRVRSLCSSVRAARTDTRPPFGAELTSNPAIDELCEWLTRVLHEEAPMRALEAARASDVPFAELLEGVDDEGFHLSGLIVRKLRFENLCRGDASVGPAFEARPDAFVERFGRYAQEVAPTAFFPAQEAQRFAAWERCER